MVRELGIGGCERDLTKIALGLDRSQFEVHVGCFYPAGFRRQELEPAGIPIAHFKVRSFASPSLVANALSLGRYVREHAIQLVHAYDYPTNLFATPAARLFRTPIVIASQLSHRDLRTAARRHLLRICDQIADVVVVNCRALERHLIDEEKVSPHRIYLCYNGVDTTIFCPSPVTPVRPAVLRGASLVIGSVCVMRPEKRLDTLLEAFARIRHLQAGLRLVLVGSGPVVKDLQELARRLQLTEICHFEPATYDVARWLRAMDIFVLPSSSEAFSNALLEAMACGCCVIGSRVGGTPELIEHQQRGLLFQPGNVDELAASLALLIQQESLRIRFAEAAVRFSHHSFNVGRAVSRMQDLYARFLTEKSAA